MSPPISHFIGGLKSVKIWGVQGIIIIWQLVFASCHRLKSKNKNNTKNNTKNNKKGCLVVMANPLDLGHGKKCLFNLSLLRNSICQWGQLTSDVKKSELVLLSKPFETFSLPYVGFLPWPRSIGLAVTIRPPFGLVFLLVYQALTWVKKKYHIANIPETPTFFRFWTP